MATRKQRRRREKGQRHEYEIVYVDDEGNELEQDEVDERRPIKEPPARRPAAKGAKRSGSGSSRPRGRVPDPPSWQRSLKRGAIFAPAFIVVLLLLNRKGSVTSAAVSMVFLIVVFIPFSYFLDGLVYRQYLKKTGQGPAPKR